MTKIEKQVKDSMIKQDLITLKRYLKYGKTVYTVLKHVSSSGMTRHISVYIALGYKTDKKNGGLIVTGCGMDMGFHVVNNLAYTLFGVMDEKKRNRKGYTNCYGLNHEWL